jgi:2-desacetyl-2-hydroxyethyl bacteriochlorophyllide A dehydrogenase
VKAIRIERPWDISVVEIEAPTPKEGEALIKTKAAGICGSDIGAFRGTNGLVTYPRVIGHELAGEIVSIPENNRRGLKPGDRVIADPYLYCGGCYPCGIGRTNCCADLKVLGVHVNGGMAEYFTHPMDMLIPVPDDIPWELVPIAEPLTIALHGLHRLQLKAGEHIAIFGAGPIGVLAAQAALSYGAVPVMIDLVAERLALAESLGVKHTVNIEKDNLAKAIAEITGGRGCECVMEASGSNAAVRLSLDIASFAGRIAYTGWPKQETPIPTDMITKKELDIRGARTSAGEFEEALELIRGGKVDARAILTETAPLENAAEIIRQIEKNPGDYMKVNIMA